MVGIGCEDGFLVLNCTVGPFNLSWDLNLEDSLERDEEERLPLDLVGEEVRVEFIDDSESYLFEEEVDGEEIEEDEEEFDRERFGWFTTLEVTVRFFFVCCCISSWFE